MQSTNLTSAPKTRHRMPLRALIGSGDRIALFTLPVVLVAVALWWLDPSRFAMAPSEAIHEIAVMVFAVGIVTWGWSVALLLTVAARGELITEGPFAVMKHPIYTSVGLLVLPAAGILLGTWLGVVIGVALYVGARRFGPAEERELRLRFGSRWDVYAQGVRLPWL